MFTCEFTCEQFEASPAPTGAQVCSGHLKVTITENGLSVTYGVQQLNCFNDEGLFLQVVKIRKQQVGLILCSAF